MSAVIKQKHTPQQKLRKCKAPGCENMYTPYSTLSRACSPKCAFVLVQIAKEKKERKETRERKRALRTKGEWLKLAQAKFNKFIMLRDKHLPCISCGTMNPNIQYAAGHYRSVGACPELRFNEDNCHKQCNSNCNNFLSGNPIEYRINLVKRIGLDRVVELEGPHEPKHYTIPDIQEIRERYRLKVKAMEKAV